MKLQRYGVVICCGLLLGVVGLILYFSRNGDRIDDSVLALQKSGVIVSPLTPIPLTGTLNKNRIYVTSSLPFSLNHYSLFIPQGQCTEENLQQIITLAKCGVLTNVTIVDDSTGVLRLGTIDELLQQSNGSEQLKQESHYRLRNIQIAVLPAALIPNPLPGTPGSPDLDQSESEPR